MSSDLERAASRVGLKTLAKPTFSVCLNGCSIEGVGQLLYLGSVVFAHGSTELDVTSRIHSARAAPSTSLTNRPLTRGRVSQKAKATVNRSHVKVG